MALTNPTAAASLFVDKSNNPLLGTQQTTIAELVDALDGATFTGDTLTTAATPTVDELETNDGAIAGKINAIIQVLAAHGLIADS